MKGDNNYPIPIWQEKMIRSANCQIVAKTTINFFSLFPIGDINTD